MVKIYLTGKPRRLSQKWNNFSGASTSIPKWLAFLRLYGTNPFLKKELEKVGKSSYIIHILLCSVVVLPIGLAPNLSKPLYLTVSLDELYSFLRKNCTVLTRGQKQLRRAKSCSKNSCLKRSVYTQLPEPSSLLSLPVSFTRNGIKPSAKRQKSTVRKSRTTSVASTS